MIKDQEDYEGSSEDVDPVQASIIGIQQRYIEANTKQSSKVYEEARTVFNCDSVALQ